MMAGAARTSEPQPFGRIMRTIDRLAGQSTPNEAYRLALQVIFLRQKGESAWLVLVGRAADNARRARRVSTSDWPTARAVGELWLRVGIARFLDLGPRGVVETPHLTGPADRLLAELIGVVAGEETIEGAFEACLERYSHRLGSADSYFTHPSITQLMVALAAPRPGERVLDPACGSAGLLTEAARFACGHGSGIAGLYLHGRDIDPEVREVAAMRLAVNSLAADLGDRAVDTLRAGSTGLGCDVVLVNPPFKQDGWGYDELENDPRWDGYGRPPRGKASFAWVLHVIGELSARGRAVMLLPDGAAKGIQRVEREIRQSLVEADVIAGIVSLPERIFPHTSVSACLWLLSKDKGAGCIPRHNQFLFVDARTLGRRVGKAIGRLTEDEIGRIWRTVYAWRGDVTVGDVAPYADESGWCRSVGRAEIAAAGHDLMPSRYVRAGSTGGGRTVPDSDASSPREELYKCFAETKSLDRQLRLVLEDA